MASKENRARRSSILKSNKNNVENGSGGSSNDNSPMLSRRVSFAGSKKVKTFDEAGLNDSVFHPAVENGAQDMSLVNSTIGAENFSVDMEISQEKSIIDKDHHELIKSKVHLHVTGHKSTTMIAAAGGRSTSEKTADENDDDLTGDLLKKFERGGDDLIKATKSLMIKDEEEESTEEDDEEYEAEEEDGDDEEKEELTAKILRKISIHQTKPPLAKSGQIPRRAFGFSSEDGTPSTKISSSDVSDLEASGAMESIDGEETKWPERKSVEEMKQEIAEIRQLRADMDKAMAETKRKAEEYIAKLRAERNQDKLQWQMAMEQVLIETGLKKTD